MSDLTGGKLKNGLLELHLGKNGATMNIGMGGADVSLGNIASAMGGLAVLDVNQRIDKYVRENKFDAAVTLRSQYGFGDAVQKGQLWDILNGDALLAEGGVDKADAAAQTKREGDKRVVHIAGYHDGMSAQEQFALGITLAHEAYRNGIDDGALGQQLETNRAVLGHIGFADRMAQTYGIAAIGEQMAYEVLTYYKAQSGQLDELAEVLSDYDSSADYWLLKKDGTLVNDGKKELRIETVGDDGKPSWAMVSGSEKETSVAGALVHYLGKERALELLKKDASDISTYDDQTLKDVLGVNDQVIAEMRKDRQFAATVLSNASAVKSNTFDRLIGEALMKQSGIQAVGNSWLGEGAGITLTDGTIHGNAAIRSLENGQYERYSITAQVTRALGAYDIYKDGKAGELGNGNTQLQFTKWSIDSGEAIASIVAGGAWNSVDNTYGQQLGGKTVGVDQPLQYLFGPTVQGNTLAAGNFNMRWAVGNSPDWGEVLTISDAKTIAGEQILSTGYGADHPAEAPWRVHWTQNAYSDGCIVVKGQANMTNLMTELKSWGLTRGYSIASTMIDQNSYYTYQYRYKARK
jgi:hypothetical protein